jgi:outer membrane protein assembly factor BamB
MSHARVERTRDHTRSRHTVRAAAAGIAVTVLLVAAPGATALGVPPRAAGPARPADAPAADWSAYLFSANHAGFNPGASTITPAVASSLVRVWHWTPAKGTQAGQVSGLYSSPVVSGGLVYIGARTGVFYALDETTGAVVWSRSLGFVKGTTCGPEGFTSTATVALDPVSATPVVYVAAADGYLYALDAATGATVWRAVVGIPSTTVNNYYNWSSPTISGGVVYIGVTSQCDAPLIPGGVLAVDQATGTVLGRYHSTPPGGRGASVWGSVLVTDDGLVFAATGNGPAGSDGDAVVQLDLDPVAQTLTRTAIWVVPRNQRGPDSDFGSSLTQFTATLNGVPTEMVGACNKNGVYYAFDAADISAGPVWSRRLGVQYRSGVGQCDAAAVWDGSRLFAGGNGTTIGGVQYQGSVRQLDPDTGAVVWEHGLPGPVIGSPSLSGGGVLSAGVFGGKAGPFLLDASSGALLWTVPFTNGKTFAQSIFTSTGLYLATSQNNGITAYQAPSAPG